MFGENISYKYECFGVQVYIIEIFSELYDVSINFLKKHFFSFEINFSYYFFFRQKENSKNIL